MRMLLTNDDGIDSEGVHVLARELSRVGEVVLSVPESERSGASHSITLSSPLEYRKVEYDGFSGYVVRGTPADCVRLAYEGLEIPFDMVISGVNSGANVGINIHYSGTVAAALEAAFLGMSGLAVSISTRQPENYGTATAYAVKMVECMRGCRQALVVNLNVPDLPPEKIRGVRITQAGVTDKETFARANENSCREVDECRDPGIVLDSRAVSAGYVSVTPLQVDLTARGMMDLLQGWELGRVER